MSKPTERVPKGWQVIAGTMPLVQPERQSQVWHLITGTETSKDSGDKLVLTACYHKFRLARVTQQYNSRARTCPVCARHAHQAGIAEPGDE